ncbi:muscle-specific protein 300 kDa isoform X4 [Bacillus rossius redtenbacheri]|uniref:muscle-specific protein 300 kDa isoform X4 n=1 Tax=Bacillus rossius redtenbacheri TaxID=93214 RepID=UPI002FDE2CE8
MEQEERAPRKLRDRVSYYEQVCASGRRQDAPEAGPVDVAELERRLEQRRRRADSPGTREVVRLRPARRPAEDSSGESFEESTERLEEEGDLLSGGARVVTFERVTLHRSVRALTPSRSPSEERLAQEDSAYHTGRLSKSSSVSSPSEDSRGEWYSEFRAQSLHSMPSRIEYIRSRSEYDAHIAKNKDEQERVQKKTFVNWINSYLSKRVPPLRMEDLIEDLKDGTRLLALLEVLSGEKLPVERGRNLKRPHFLSNANTALQFLQSKKIKLVNINSSDLVDGRPPVVLGLIWTIILYFQIEENTRVLEALGHSLGGSTSSLEGGARSDSALPADRRRLGPEEKRRQGARKAMLQWVSNAIPQDLGIEVKDFGTSWRDGNAFLAIIDAIKSNLVNLVAMREASNRARLETAFTVAESQLGIARLLDPEDVDVPRPDEKSIMTYVAQFLHKYPEPRTADGSSTLAAVESEYNELVSWLTKNTQLLENLQRTSSLPVVYSEYAALKSDFDGRVAVHDKLCKLVEAQSMISISYESWQEIDRLWFKLEAQLRHWLWLLDSSLPGALGQVGEWLGRAEALVVSDDIPSAMNEETATIISRKLEEHKAFFAELPAVQAKFQQAQSSPLVSSVPSEQLQHLARRLDEIGPRAARRRVHLKFLEHKCCLIAFLHLTETKLRGWTVKYGREEKVIQLLEQYRNFVSRNRIFQEFNKAYIDMQQVIEEYKREGNVDQREGAATDRFMRETGERWKNVSMELRCVQSMLEEVVAYWRRWNSLADEFEAWLDRAYSAIHLSEEDRMEYFQDVSVWKDKHQLLGDTVSFLIATCEDQVARELKERFMRMCTRWDELFPSIKQYMHAGDVLRHRKDYRAGTEKLQAWLRSAEAVLSSSQLSSTEKIKAYGEQLQKLQNEVEGIEDLFKAVSKKFQVMIQDLSRDEVDRNMNTLKKEKEALVRVRALIPMQLHLFHQILVQQESLEAGQLEISRWLDEAEAQLASELLAGGKEAVQAQLDRHKLFFSRTLYYKSMLESKNKVFQSIVKSVDHSEGIDTEEFQQRMLQLNERFARVTQQAQQWELKLQEAIRCWHNFRESEHVISDWLQKAEKLISEKHIDTKQAVQSHKSFFDQVNERWTQDLVNSAQDLRQCLPADQHRPVSEAVEQLQARWKEVLSFAPLHLMRLEFRLDETTFTQYLKEIEKEIHSEQQSFHRHEDVEAILTRHKEFFEERRPMAEMERSLERMSEQAAQYARFQPSDPSLQAALSRARAQQQGLSGKVAALQQQLQQIPQRWKEYQDRFSEMVKWMDSVDESLKRIVTEVNSLEEFEKERTVFQGICREVEVKRENMKWLVQTLDALAAHVSEEESATEQTRLEQLISRYKNLIPTIELTITKTDVHYKCYTYRKEVREVCGLLQKVKETSVTGAHPETLDSVNVMIRQQETAVGQLDLQRPNIMSMLQRGKELERDAHAPAFVGAEVQSLETGWNQAYTHTVDKLNKLRGTQKVWSSYVDQKDEILQLLEQAEAELQQPSGSHDSRQLAAELQAKQQMSVQLRKATEEALRRLRDLCSQLGQIAAPERKPLLQKEVTEIERRLHVTLETVQERVEYLEQFTAHWSRFQSRLGELQDWARHAAPATLAQAQAAELTPEERVRRSQLLLAQLVDRIAVLDALRAEARQLLREDSDNVDAGQLGQEVDQLRAELVAVQRAVEGQISAVGQDLQHWQEYRASLEQIRPWVEQAEVKVNMGIPRPVSLQEAQQLLDSVKALEQECEAQLGRIQEVAAIGQQITCRTSAADEVDVVHSRWTAVHDVAMEQGSRLEKMVAGWQELDAEVKQLEEWLQREERALLEQPVNLNTPQVDVLEKELGRLKAFNNEVSEKQAQLVSLTATSDNISQGLALEGASAVKGQVTEMKAKVNKLAEAVRAKINTVSDLIMARQELEVKMADFTTWLGDLEGRVAKGAVVRLDQADSALQAVHALVQEHSEQQLAFNAIYDEVKGLQSASSPAETETLTHGYSALVAQYQELEDRLQERKAALEKWSELLSWHADASGQLGHLRFQLEGQKPQADVLAALGRELAGISAGVRDWSSTAPAIDGASRQSDTALVDARTGESVTAVLLVDGLREKAAVLQMQLADKKKVLEKVGAQWTHFQQLQQNLSEDILETQALIQETLFKVDSFDKLDQAVRDISSLLEKHKQKQEAKDILHKEGKILLDEDQSNISTIQNILASIDANWEKVNETIKEQKAKYTEMNIAWKQFNDAKEKVYSGISEAHKICESAQDAPNDFMQANILHEKTKKALETLKKAKFSLDTMDNKGQILFKQAEPISDFKVSVVEDELKKVHTEWQHAYDKLIKKFQSLEAQIIIWKQIEESKNEVLHWLSETSDGLSNALENMSDSDGGQARLNKYKDELPSYYNLKTSIVTKTSQLMKLNDGKPIPTLDSLNKLLDDEFLDIKNVADKLEDIACMFGEREKNIRDDIKKASDSITKIREALIRCDDLTGENTKILERLQKCQHLKQELLNFGSDLKNVNERIDEIKTRYPSFGESGLAKELGGLQERYSSVLLHANKVESTLLSFLKKYHVEKLGMLQRGVTTHKEKVAWCFPEAGSDRYNLEVKLSSLRDVEAGLNDFEAKKADLDQSLQLLEQVEKQDKIQELAAERKVVVTELQALKSTYDTTKQSLEHNISLWQKYELMSENIASWLKESEGKVRAESVNQLNFSSLGDKIKEIEVFKKQITDYEPEIKEMKNVSDEIMTESPDSRVGQYVGHLVSRYQAVLKFVNTYIERLQVLSRNKDSYRQAVDDMEKWLGNAEGKLKSYENLISSGAKPMQTYQLKLEELKAFAEEKEKGQALLNKAIELGEALFPGITPENREAVRAELRALRDSSESVIDRVNVVHKKVEGIMLQRSSFEDSYKQVKQWVTDVQTKLGDKVELKATLKEKKIAMHGYRALAQDVNTHKNIMKQLQEKIGAMSDSEAADKFDTILSTYRKLSKDVDERIAVSEKHVTDHESYLQALEKMRDWLSALSMEAAFVSDEALLEKEGADNKLMLIETLLQHKEEGDKLIEACSRQVEVVLQQTESSGHPRLLKEFEEQKKAWEVFLSRCAEAQNKLKQLCSRWTEFEEVIDALTAWTKQKELQVKDQSLRSTLEAKQSHLSKLKSVEEEILAKGEDFNKASEQSQFIKGESELSVKVSRLLTRYQALKNTTKESVMRYEQFVKEHKSFSDEHAAFLEWLSRTDAELKELSEIVGDLTVLQDRQKKIRELADVKSRESAKFDTLVDKGEKLYAHTSPDGREIIRQQLRTLRSMWDSLSDKLQGSTHKLDQCLMQFAEFTLSQEQLTKWLKDVEKAMAQHTELKASLQEKRAQLQNHKMMHQEIMSHQQLVESVCDKAQQLVDQTQDKSLNVYLQSIKQLFHNIVAKSQDLLDNLEECVKRHLEFSNQCKSFSNWLSTQANSLHDCDDVSGEKADVSKRLETVKMLQDSQGEGEQQLGQLRELCKLVSQSTVPKGIDDLQKEVDGLEAAHKEHLSRIGAVESKLAGLLRQWEQFEQQLEAHSAWFRATEAAFREQPLQATLEDKAARLEGYLAQRALITDKEPAVDAFVDRSHSLLHSSGADRIRPLVAQISNRYQLLLVLSKEVIGKWQGLVEDHRAYRDQHAEALGWLAASEEHLRGLQGGDAPGRLQALLLEREQAPHRLASLAAAGERLLPDTSAHGRELVRQQLRQLRDRWDLLEEGIKEQQKRQDAQLLQWSSYQEMLQQTLAWLDAMEKTLQPDTAWTSTQETRSKLLKHKTTLQEVISHKRIMEAVTEKAEALVRSTGNEAAGREVQDTVASINQRYERLVNNLLVFITQLEEALDAFQQFHDLQKSHQDFQKQLWDRLAGYSDYSGNKPALQARLSKVLEIHDSVDEGTARLDSLGSHVANKMDRLPARAREAMERDLANLRFEFEKFVASLKEAQHGLEERLQQWSEYEGSFDRLLSWLSEAEAALKSYAPRSTLEEKQEQREKYQDLIKIIESRNRDVKEIVTLADHLEQSLILSLRQNEAEFDKMSDDSSELVQISGETRISVNVQQITSRFQSIQSTAKDIVKKCEQAVADHEAYLARYEQCCSWLAEAQARFDKWRAESGSGARPDLLRCSAALQGLLSEQASASQLLNATVELGEKLYPSTATEGREAVRQQLQELQQALEGLFDAASSLQRQLQAKLSRWSGFEECSKKLRRWLGEVESQLPAELELKATLDEKRAQLQTYRALLHDAVAHQQDIVSLRDKTESLPESNREIDRQLQLLTEQHAGILKRAQNFVERYEAIVNDHQQYSKAVMETQEWLEATHNTVLLWGDTELERLSLHTNLERLRNLQLSLPEEELRVSSIRTLGEKVIPGTVESGQVNIRSQIDSSQLEWQGLLSTIKSTIEALDNKLQQWNEYETMKDQCMSWIRDTDTKLHAVDLKATAQEKKQQLEVLKALQGEVRAKELEMDSVTERAQQLHKGAMSSRSSQISELGLKYQQVSHKVKDLTSRWHQYVMSHQEFDNHIKECTQWLEDIRNKLSYCSDLSAPSQKDLEGKLETIQGLLLYKEEGFSKVQGLVELAQTVLANTAPSGHDAINHTLGRLQEEWSVLASRMIEIKAILDESIHRWSGFLEQIHQLNKTVDYLEVVSNEISEFQTTISEKRTQLERIKGLDEKVRCEKIEVESLKAKAAEMLASGQQSHAATQAQEILHKFDFLADRIKNLVSEREDQYKDHRLYKEAYDNLTAWLNRAREKVPSLKQRPLSDKLAIESAVVPLDALLNKQAQGELLVEHLTHTGEVVMASTSPQGQESVRNEIRALRESFEGLFKDIKQQKEQLEATMLQWRDYKEEYERLSDWLQQIDILVKAQKTALLATLPEKSKQVLEVQDILQKLEKGQEQIEKFNNNASVLLTSHLDTYVNNQLRHLNSRYQVQVNLAKDVLKKVETNLEQHQQYEDNLAKAQTWIDNAKQVIRDCSEASSNSTREVLEGRLGQIQELLRKREEGQNLVHTTVNCGERVVRNTRSDGRDVINAQLKEVQNDWDRLVKKLSTAKVHLETSLLQWADYSSSYSQLQQWITDREAKLQQVCEQKVTKAKKGQAPGMSSLSIGERKATLRQTNSIVQDIVSFEPMIQSVTLKAEDLLQAQPASEISSKYETLSKQAKELYARQKETVEHHQAFIDAGNDFVQWLRAAKEKLSKCSEPTGDKESLGSKVSQLKVLESEQEDGQKKLEKALEQADVACQVADAEDKEIIEEEVALLQEEFDTYTESLCQTKSLLEVGIVRWTEYEDQFQEASDWLTQTEQIVQSFNKLQDSLEEKKNVLEQFQGHLQTLFDWQKELDRLNMKAQMLLETCADTRISNAVTQLTTKYNALLSLAKEIMRRLELHYQEHQQHNALYQECQDWVDRTEDKLRECQEPSSSLADVRNKLQTVRTIRQSLEQGQNKLRYALELKEKVILNTEQNGAAKIQEDTENLKQEFEKLMTDVHEIRQKLATRASQLEELQKAHKVLADWLEELEQKVRPDGAQEHLNDLSEKRATLEKLRSVQRDILSHSEMVERLMSRLADNPTIPAAPFQASLDKYKHLKFSVIQNIATLEEQVREHEEYKQASLDAADWVRKTRIEIQQCGDSHGEKEATVDKEARVAAIAANMPRGEQLVERTVALSGTVLKTTGTEGQDSLRQETQQLKADWEGLCVMLKDTQKVLAKCISSWNDYADTAGRMKSWLASFQEKVDSELADDKKSPDDLQRCRALLQEAGQQKAVMEELNDRCESLMEQSACSWVRDQTVQLQASYSNLLTALQGLVLRVEKNLSDHTEFVKAKEEFDSWLKRAHGTVKDCEGVSDEATTKDKLETIRLVATRMTEGQHLMSRLQEVFTKAINTTPAEQQDCLREDMACLHNSWDQLNMDLTSVTAQLKAAMSRWEDYEDSKSRLQRWISDTERLLQESPNTKAELGEMKTLVERYKHYQDEIQVKRGDLDHLLSEAAELSVWASRPEVLDEARRLQSRWDQLASGCAARKHNLELEIQEYSAYHQSLQETEKWLLQISFQLMAHNSLYITNREQTQQQIQQHQALLEDIQKYQATLDDVKAKGQGQIERYKATTPDIKDTIEKQLHNVQESYDSLLHTALQIQSRLQESLAKFQEYEDTLESIMSNLDGLEPLIAQEIETPVSSLKATQQQLEVARGLHNKLQSEKARLAVAVQACEAAAACVSRPSSPQDVVAVAAPDRELVVRARLEDLVDQQHDDEQKDDSGRSKKLKLLLDNLESQGYLSRLNTLTEKVQARLGGLASSLSELEDLQRQRSALQQWAEQQRVVVADWRSRPSKLRPEAARAELAAMTELLATVGERRTRLLTELPAVDEDDGLEGRLESLEAELAAVLGKKQAAQGVMEELRARVQHTLAWLDALAKRLEGPDCHRKLAAVAGIARELDQLGPERLAEVRRLAGDVTDLVSNLDSQQVEEQLKTVERRYKDVATRVQRKTQVLEMARKGLEDAIREISQARDWVGEKKAQLESQPPLGFESKVAEERLQSLKALLKEVDGKRVLLETLEKLVGGMQAELEPGEQQQLEASSAGLHAEHADLSSRLRAETGRLAAAVDSRRRLEAGLESARAWLKAERQQVQRLSGFLPLHADRVQQEMLRCKGFSADIQDFEDKTLSDLQKQVNVLLKDCSDPDKEKLQSLLKGVVHEHKALKIDTEEKLAALKDLLEGRKQFEADIDGCKQWLKEAEVATSAEIRAPNVELLEEQLAKYDKLSEEAEGMRDQLDGVMERGKAVLPTLSEADKLELSEQLSTLKDKLANITGLIRDRSDALKGQLKQYVEAAAKVAESIQFVTKIQNELKELNHPIGSKVEDVHGMLAQYENILEDLKANKLRLGDAQLGNMGELQGIAQQQDDLIRAIEAQIARLRQLLLLREQFIALVTEIMTFITKYTEVVRDIERGGHTVQEKIKKYDDVVLKIQECEATLASATDKGQQIAAEGSAADRNSVTEQLQSLKQSLQALRRAVEKQREQHEMTAAEHGKLGAELEAVLDWLHANEAAVRSRPLLARDTASVDRQLDRHQELAAAVHGHLDRARAVQESARHEEGMPGSLMEKLSEAALLLNTLPRELEERGKYLQANRQMRLDHALLKDRLHAWVRDAEAKLQEGASGVDFHNIVAHLQDHQVFFSSEPAMKELVSQQLQQAADRIWPSLTGPEQEELSVEQQQLTQLLKNTLNSAKSRRAQLEQDVELWRDYCLALERVRAVLARTHFSDEPVASLAGLHFSAQKITHALDDLQKQQAEVELLGQRSADVTRQADAPSRQQIQQQCRELTQEWADLVSGLERRRDTFTKLAQHWEEFESKWQSFESLVSGYEEKSKHIDMTVRSKNQVAEVEQTLQDLLGEVEGHRPQHEEVLFLSGTVLTYLTAFSEPSAQALKGKLHQLTDNYNKLVESLRSKCSNIKEEFDNIKAVEVDIEAKRQELERVDSQVRSLYVFGEDLDSSEAALQAVKCEAEDCVSKAKTLTSETREWYINLQQLVPTDIAQQLSSLELLWEAVSGAMEEKDREMKRARTVRTEYTRDVEQVQSWLQQAQTRVQDRLLEPRQMKECLAQVQSEIGEVSDKLERVRKNGEVLLENSRDENEKQLVQRTVANLTDELQKVRSWLDDKKQQVADCLDSWERFMSLYQAVKSWVDDKQTFLLEPLQLSSLTQTRQRLHDYSVAVKSCKQVSKSLSDMSKELERLAQLTSVGDLPDKLEEAEEAKGEVESRLNERNSLLQETSEEWEQCEKKMKDVRAWLEKSRQALESPQNKKRPLRDQLALREKMLSDVAVQKTKISMSVEKLQVHFRSGVGGDTKVTESAAEILKELDQLCDVVKEQTSGLETCLAQLDQYQQEIQQLRQQIVQVEQQLRIVLSPTYMSHDREKAQEEQNIYNDRVVALQTKIAARNERIKLLAQRCTPDTEPLDS